MKLQIRLDDTDALRFRQLGKLFPDAVKNGMRALVLALTRYTIQKKFENQGPRYLNRQTGTAIRSIVASAAVEVTGSLITGRWGSNLDYVKKHEEGGTFTENVRAHTRRVRSRDVRALVLNDLTGKTSRRIVGRGIAFVRAHTRVRTYRARQMFLDAFSEKERVMAVPLRRSVELLLLNARVPTVGAIGDLQ